MESNDSPEIPDRGETSDIPGLPSGEKMMMMMEEKKEKKKKKKKMMMMEENNNNKLMMMIMMMMVDSSHTRILTGLGLALACPLVAVEADWVCVWGGGGGIISTHLLFDILDSVALQEGRKENVQPETIWS